MFGCFSNSTGKGVLDGLKAVNLGCVNVEEERITTVEFSMNYRPTCSNCGCGFEIK